MPQHSSDTRTALVVVAHHRSDSLTAHTARRAAAQIEAAGYRIDLLDLHAEGFDPRMNVEDQPDWANREKPYSDETRAHMRRILDADPGRLLPPDRRRQAREIKIRAERKCGEAMTEFLAPTNEADTRQIAAAA